MNISFVIISIIIPLLSFFAYTGLLVVILRQRMSRVQKAYAVFLATLAAWGLVCFLTYSALLPGYTLVFYEFIAVSVMLQVASYYHFLRAFMNKPAAASPCW